MTTSDDKYQAPIQPLDKGIESKQMRWRAERAEEKIRRLTERIKGLNCQVTALEQGMDAMHKLAHQRLQLQACLESENEALRDTITAAQADECSGHCPTNSSGGVTVVLPHMTHTIAAVLAVFEEYWPPRGERRPPKSTNVSRAIDERLRWKPQRNGTPSRSAQTFAAAMRPDELSAADGRNQRRRSRD